MGKSVRDTHNNVTQTDSNLVIPAQITPVPEDPIPALWINNEIGKNNYDDQHILKKADIK